MSIENISIVGTAIFEEITQNGGIIDHASFNDSSVNIGTVTTASFSGTAVNDGIVSIAVFEESAINSGSIIETAIFSDTSSNTGSISGTVTFSGSASNDGGLITGSAIFSDTSLNTGTVSEAIFIGSSNNTGTITVSAKFADQSLNDGVIQGNAVFADSTTNNGVVQGDAQIAGTANNSSGTVIGFIEPYTQPDGYFPNGYYSGGTKTAPPNYDTVVYQVGTFWYKYDSSGNGSLASGNYSDGSSIYTFSNGIKGSAYVPEFLPDGTFIRTENNPNPYTGIGANSNTNGTVDIVADGNGGERYGDYHYPSNGSVTFGGISLTIYISEFSGGQSFSNGQSDVISDGNGSYYITDPYNRPAQGYVFATDGTNNYVADGNGGYVIYLVNGTFIRNEDITVMMDGNTFIVGNVDIYADGTGGETQGTPSYVSNGTLLTSTSYNYYADGNGGVYTCVLNGQFIRTDVINVIIPETNNQAFQVGTADITGDGSCGEIQTPSYISSGTLLTTYGGYNYYSDGAGSYYSEEAV